MKKGYKHNFYKDRHQSTIDAANNILSLVIEALPKLESAVDFGCGVGTWLSVLKEKGVSDVRGLEGAWVEKNLLKISEEELTEVNFEKGVKLDKKYDLAITLEVAEHLKPETASKFVQSLTTASDYVMFSAAIPFQGGTNHVNEQWPDYWVDLFEKENYVLIDFIRMKIWNDEAIPVWYRQNILMFVKKEKLDSMKLPAPEEFRFPLSVVHPETYISKMNKLYSVKGNLKMLPRSIKRWFKK
ncbi:MAG: hypothetical protein DIZ80_15770 [endosymbiont of Galathealinum brachiosum]|uniref:Class I SAM-dependent methyltransferase n=1 Tax=endosymbiont of Galathealinum brachiosum TaxID=2200906 RepID=A0A370DAY2_9GAMM|nr:MAG: hypothetical protein DIZ80_15770 [endosymbiont of Galathealinum brachiosum]